MRSFVAVLLVLAAIESAGILRAQMTAGSDGLASFASLL
jgi:hypothetical protein